jgi:hypothetical protein
VRKFLAGLVLLAFVGATPVLAAGEEGTPDPVDIVILVDESASLSSAAVRSEKEALQKIVSSIVISNEGIRLGILPFSSGADSPRDVPECGLTETDPSGIANLTKCVNQVVRQQKRGRADTDFAQAIEKAVSDFDNSQATKIVVLLTDGKYDPDGNESISPAEQATLDEVLQDAKKKKVSLWSLGFGKADIKALQSYIDKTFDGSESCSTKSTAVLAEGLDLSKKFEKIIDFATCTGHISGSANPDFNFSVSPLLSKINIEASAKTGSLRTTSVVVKDSNGESVCEEQELVAGRWRCSETLTGDNAGEWIITDQTGKDLSIDVTYSGRINIEVIDCKIKKDQSPAPKILLTRADGEVIDFDVEGVNWPKVEYKVARGEDDSFASGSNDLYSSESKILGSSNFAVGDKVSLKPDSSGQLLIRVVGIANCTIIDPEPPPTTTLLPPTTPPTPPPTTLPPVCPGPGCPDPQPWLLYLLIVALLSGGGFFAWKKMGKKFPEGAELQVRNHFNQNVFDFVQQIGGQRKVYFDVVATSNTPAVSVFSTKSEARYMLELIGDEEIQVTSLWKAIEPEIEEDRSILDQDPIVQVGNPVVFLVDEAFNPRNSDPDGSDGRRDQIILKVTWPVDEDE